MYTKLFPYISLLTQQVELIFDMQLFKNPR